MEQQYKGFTIRSEAVKPTGAFARHWFGVYQAGQLAFEAEVQVSCLHTGDLDGAERLAAVRGRRWVNERIDRGDYVPGQSYRVQYLPGCDQPKVTTDMPR